MSSILTSPWFWLSTSALFFVLWFLCETCKPKSRLGASGNSDKFCRERKPPHPSLFDARAIASVTRPDVPAESIRKACNDAATAAKGPRLTTDRSNPDLNKAPNADGTGQNNVYLVLSDAAIAKGFTRPYRATYQHLPCSGVTTMGVKISETYAADPKFYGSTFCATCSNHFPVGQFVWTKDNQVVGS